MDLRFKSKDIQDFRSNITSSHPIIKALKSGKLIIFVGAGMSVHLEIPGWREFALKYLDLVSENKNLAFMNYKTKESLKNEDTRKLLSICKFVAEENMTLSERINAYKEWFKVDIGKVREKRLYVKLYNLNAIYITTNYDNALDLLAKQAKTPELSIEGKGLDKEKISVNMKGEVFYDLDKLTRDVLRIGNVIHIHGSIENTLDKNTDELVISYEDYIERYGRYQTDEKKIHIQNLYSEFLEAVFNEDKVVLFIGYGLEELEILQYLLYDELKKRNRIIPISNRYFLLGCYSDDNLKISCLANYYEYRYKVTMIPYDITENGYEKMEELLDYLNELKDSNELNENKKVDELKHVIRLIEEI